MIVTPRFHGYGDVTATYIRKSKYLPVYTLSISTDKNQSTEANGTLYVPTYIYNYRIITRVITILHEYHITNAQMREYKRYTYMNSIRERSRDSWRTTLPLRYSDQQRRNPYAPIPGHENPGESVKLPRRV